MKKEKTFTGREALNAFLGEGTSFKGILSFEGTVRIDGHLEGEVYTKDTLVIGETAVVKAKIQAGMVIISGTIHGDVTADKKVEVHATGKLFGNIAAPLLSIEEGVVFEGRCTMGRGGEASTEGVEDKKAAEEDQILMKKIT